MKFIIAIAAIVQHIDGRMLRMRQEPIIDPEFSEPAWVYPKDAQSWDPATLPACPDGIPHDRTLMPDHETYASKYPSVGATCVLAIGSGKFEILPIAAFAQH